MRAALPDDNDVLMIGVAGHRVLTDVERIEAGIDEALKTIATTYPRRRWKVISALAEGTDRLVVRRACARCEVQLIVPLPLPAADYTTDFTSRASVEEFEGLLSQAEVVRLPSAPTRQAAYAAAGDWVVDHADLLLAVWDGQASQGQIGTAAVVWRARERGLPIAWVHAGNRRPGTREPTTLGEEQGQVTVERLEVLGLEKAFQRRDRQATAHQKRREKMAKFAAALGPIAVLFLSIQVVALGPIAHLLLPASWEHGVGIVLIALELLVLAIALAISFLQIGRSHRLWIEERLRAELLRREKFLLRTRTGPYLKTRTELLHEKVHARLLTLDSDFNDPLVLLAMEDESGHWRDALENARQDPDVSEIPDFSLCLDAYLEQRVEDQRQWFARRSSEHGKRAHNFELLAKLTLTVVLIVAALHFGHLIKGTEDTSKIDWVEVVLIVIAIVAPAIGAALVGLQSISGSQRLSPSYVAHVRALERYEMLLTQLRAEPGPPARADHASQFKRAVLGTEELLQSISGSQRLSPSYLAHVRASERYEMLLTQLRAEPAPPARADHEFRFKRVVLGTEELLSNELRLWWVIMHSEAPRAGP